MTARTGAATGVLTGGWGGAGFVAKFGNALFAGAGSVKCNATVSVATALWTPAAITTLAWYDANISGSVTIGGGFVSSWADQSGNVKNLTPTSVFNLTYSATALSTSKPGITFDGSNGFTNGSFGIASGTKVSAFAAAQMNFANITTYGRLVSIAQSGQPDYNGAASGDIPLVREGNSARISTWGTTPTTDQTTNVAFVTSGMNYSTFAENRVNGTTQNAVSYTYGTFSVDKLGIGYGVDGVGSPWGGVISEVVLIGTDPTANIVVNEGTFTVYQVMEGYLAWKWGTQASLPGGHPFAAGAPHVVAAAGTAWSGAALLPGTGALLSSATLMLASTALLGGAGTLVAKEYGFSVAGTVFTKTLALVQSGWAGKTLRQRLEPSLIDDIAATSFSVRLEFATGTSGNIAAAYVGHAAAAGDAYDFDGSQVQLLFDGGNATKAVSGAVSVTSDLVTFDVDPTRALIVAVAFSGTTINLKGF